MYVCMYHTYPLVYVYMYMYGVIQTKWRTWVNMLPIKGYRKLIMERVNESGADGDRGDEEMLYGVFD